VNGPWGSGKSSALNLILYHLEPLIKEKKLKVVRFSPWWLSSTAAITAAFLGDLENAIGQSAGEAALKAFQNVARRVLRFGKVAEVAADIGLPGAGKAVEGVTQALDALLPNEDDIEAQQRKVSELLTKADCRFLVIIDDIDRLAPDDAIEVFKLVKSVGQLSNVIYILAFDRELAERVVSDRFPSEGPHYLEKILQAAFEVPAVSAADLREAFLAEVNTICPATGSEDPVRFMNIVLEVVAPLLKSPRDLKRLIGMLQVTWPAVGPEVDRADFVAIEALRLFEPGLYRAIRANSDRLTGVESGSGDRRSRASEYDDLLLKAIPESDRPRMQRALRRLFPRLEAVWANVHYSADGAWRRQRRICSDEHFTTYFRFAISEGALPAEKISALVEKANDRNFVQVTLRRALEEKLTSGKTKASVYLDELIVHATDIPVDHIAPLVSALFEIADELDGDSDKDRGFASIGDNRLRMHWLLNSLVRERVGQPQRTQILCAAMQVASLHWFCDFAERCDREHKERQDGTIMPEGEWFVDRETAGDFVRDALKRLRGAAKDGTLAQHPRLLSLLWEWVRLSPRGLDEVRPKVSKFLSDDGFILHLASSAVGVTWSHSVGFDGMGDLVARRTRRVQKDSIAPLIDPLVFLARVQEVASRTTDADTASFLASFVEIWDSSPPMSEVP
jgi:predicted KAP-like P-loop ATPase